MKVCQNLFRDPYPRNKQLIFEDYELCFPSIRFFYRAGGKRYTSVARIDLPIELLEQLNRADHHPLFVNLGLSIAPAFFLLGDFESVCCACAKLEAADIEFQEFQLLECLGEFRYLQGLDPSRPVRVTSSSDVALRAISFPNIEEKALILNGGGKDSCVSAELLKCIDLPFAWLNAFPNPPRDRVVASSGVSEAYSVAFTIDEEVARDAVYAWGARPYIYTIFSASLIVSYLKGFKYLVTGMENSADAPNLMYKGVEVNHQAGKTSAFEGFFNEFVQRSVLQDAAVFSIARPFTDLRLAEIFSHFPAYFDAFFSCNVGMGTDKWCNRCHKCAFTYLALYPFIDTETLINIFGEDLFESPELRKCIIELTGSMKPWECVGTKEESKLALYYCLQKSPAMDFKVWPKRSDLLRACEDVDVAEAYKNTMSTFLLPHNIPSQLEAPLQIFSQELLEASHEKWPAVLKERS